MRKSYLEKIISIVGTQKALADSLGVKQAHVWAWLNKTVDGIPAEHVIPACRLVNFQVIPHQLREDLYPHPLDGIPSDLRSAA